MTVLDWFFGNTLGIISLCVIGLVILVAAGAIIQKREDNDALKVFNTGPPEERVRVVSGILSALLGRTDLSVSGLHKLTGLNDALLIYVISQLARQDYVIQSANGRFNLTRKGIDLYNQYHAGNQGEVRKGGEVNINMGDVFRNIGPGAVVINRSTVTNALNRVRTDYSAEAAAALQELVDAVERTREPQAIDSLNALTEELDKPQPSKSRLRVWLDAITSALPNMVDIGAAVAKVALLIL